MFLMLVMWVIELIRKTIATIRNRELGLNNAWFFIGVNPDIVHAQHPIYFLLD